MAQGCQHHGSHTHGPPSHVRRLWIIILLVAGYAVAEVVGGFWTNSLALLADAGHMVSDLASLLISLFAAWMATRQAGRHQTFGFHRAEILAALINGALLFVVAGGILHEAWERLQTPHVVIAGPMLAIAIGGLIVNLISLGVLHGEHEENLNLRGAWLHLIGDTLGSVAVIVAAILIWTLGWTWADPVASILACLVILYSAWHLMSDAMRILMEYAPRDVDVDHVRRQLLGLPDVSDVHCLHIWTIASGLKAISAHVVVADLVHSADHLSRMQELLRTEFDLKHITLQLETEAIYACENRADGACLLTH
ncbi:cation diffusion facilitator family transporter [Planctomicrobium piriforme]|uniref:Cobalt-zinc-cadmium efflux system protein n=1 Tax=Planctomicrobium piriforme TaxID=1576369 RepID=A0A1I3TA00_9PLAN|nr:cation diffusion facilitator family transporter [Planctomicrobium piriforme]SFJ66496.1 cobalt-zinc-cadmium efflux system protein [Planctomicrobium piriforme]